MTTPKLTLPVLVEGQTNSESTVNETFQIVDALMAGRVEDRDLTSPPASPANGDTYIVGASATGDWASQDGNVAIYNSGWTFVSPVGGMQIFVHDEKILMCYSSAESEWFPVQPMHSTSEHWTGRYGEGGAKLYAKCFTGLSCPNNATTNHAHGITNIDLTKRINFEMSLTDGIAVSEANFSNSSVSLYAQVTATNLEIITDYNASGSTADVRLEYCRTS